MQRMLSHTTFQNTLMRLSTSSRRLDPRPTSSSTVMPEFRGAPQFWLPIWCEKKIWQCESASTWSGANVGRYTPTEVADFMSIEAFWDSWLSLRGDFIPEKLGSTLTTSRDPSRRTSLLRGPRDRKAETTSPSIEDPNPSTPTNIWLITTEISTRIAHSTKIGTTTWRNTFHPTPRKRNHNSQDSMRNWGLNTYEYKMTDMNPNLEMIHSNPLSIESNTLTTKKSTKSRFISVILIRLMGKEQGNWTLETIRCPSIIWVMQRHTITFTSIIVKNVSWPIRLTRPPNILL